MPFRVLPALVVCLGMVATAHAQTGAHVLVVANDALPASVEIAEYYAQRRQVPAAQVLRIRTAVADQVSRPEFEARIQAPIRLWLARHTAQDRILYIVLTKGIPLRIAGTGGRQGTIASVDSELTLLYRRMTGSAVAPNGIVANPYFLGDGAISSARRFSHASHDIYLVTRLDGFTVDDVKALIDRGVAPATTGRIVLDQRASLNDKPNDWLAAAAAKLEAQGLGQRVLLEETSRPVDPQKQVLGYASWGSNDPALTDRMPDVEFVPGALASVFVSTDARTFVEPPEEWKPGPWESRPSYYAGSPQSLTGDLVRAGVTGSSGYVAEPYLDTSVRPDILFPAYVAGFSLAESYYLAMPALSWQTVVVGDPLCNPFNKAPLSSTDLQPPIDPETELPAQFAARRLAAAGLKGDVRAQKLVLKAEARLVQGNRAGARQALEEAVAREEALTMAWRELGILYELDKEHAKAIAAYRKVIDRDPKDPVALNNLAYALAVHEQNPKDALPLAERALLLEPTSAMIADTVGWIRHLLGDDAAAIKLLAPAAKALPGSVDVQLHAAVVFAALGQLEEAASALKAAAAIDPAASERPEYREAQQKIGK